MGLGELKKEISRNKLNWNVLFSIVLFIGTFAPPVVYLFFLTKLLSQKSPKEKCRATL